MIAGMDMVFKSIEINPYAADAPLALKKFRADLDSGLIINPNTKHIAPEPIAPVDVQQANQQLSDGVNMMKHALVRVDYDMRQKSPDIITDMGFHYGAHVRPLPEFYTSYKEDGRLDQTERIDKGFKDTEYNFAVSSAWDFTVENGQFRAYSKSISKGQYDYATKGDAGGGTGSWGGTGMVQAVSQDQLDVIQKTLNDNKELLKGVTQLLNGIQGTHNDLANAPNLSLKELIRKSEILAMQETGRRPDKDYQDLNKAELSTFYRKTAHTMDSSLQTTNNINAYA